jgi:DNA-binding MarR family transcriptional regulator
MDDTRRALALQLVEVMHLVGRLVALELRHGPLGLDPVHFRLLKRLFKSPCSLSELARWQGVSLPTMSNTASTLAARGLVERARDTGDRRLLWLAITPAGVEALTTVQDGLVSSLSALLENRSPVELAALGAGLTTLASALEGLPPGECRHLHATPAAGAPIVP